MPKPFSELFEFSFIPYYMDKIESLAETLVDKEEWDYGTPTIKKYPILKNYLEYTFRKIKREDKIAYTEDKNYACFNTGLVTSNLEDIYAFFEKYKIKKGGRPPKQPYVLKAFLKKSSNILVQHFASNYPDVANFFESPEFLIYNPKCELIPDIDHIIEDNLDRFPPHLKTADSATVRRHLSGAIEEMKKRVRSNYKLAVPQYHMGRYQLLLPLSLTSGSQNPDLALVIHKVNSNTYTSRTCLTLKMAYSNARLIVKPESNWLKP